MTHVQLTSTGSAESWAGDIDVPDYTWETPQARAYGQARVRLERNHPITTQAGITSFRGTRVSIPHHLLGAWNGIQIGRAGHGETTWDLQCYQTAALLKH